MKAISSVFKIVDFIAVFSRCRIKEMCVWVCVRDVCGYKLGSCRVDLHYLGPRNLGSKKDLTFMLKIGPCNLEG